MQENRDLIGIAAILVAIAVAWFKMKPAMRKISADEDAALRGDLLERVRQLEQDLKDERRDCRAELSELRHEHNQAIHALNTRYELAIATFTKTIESFHEILKGIK